MANAQDLLARITVPKSEQTARRKSVLLKGLPGTGKTWNALHMPGPIICVYADNNRSTLETLMRERDDITEVRISQWSDFDPGFINYIKNRELEYETIIIDSIDELFNILVDKERGNQTKLNFDNWANVANTQRRCTFELTQACRPQADKRDYNFVATVHTREQTDGDGNLASIQPKIQGGFRESIEAYFDYVLMTDTETKYNKDTKEMNTVPFIRTVKPNNYHTVKAPIHWPGRVASLEDIQKIIDEEASKAS